MGPYTSRSPETYKSPAEESMERYLAEKEIRLEKTKKQIERLREIELNDWIEKLTKADICNILGEKMKKITGSNSLKERIKRGYLAKYFTEELWPDKFQKMKVKIFTT